MEPIDEVLESRRQRSETGRRTASVLTATALHVGALAAAILGPQLAARTAEPIEYVSAVRLMAAPPPRAPAPPPAQEPQPEAPQPAPPDPEPDRPTLAAPSRQPAAEPTKLTPPKPRERRSQQPRTRPAPRASSATAAVAGAAVAGFDSPDFTYGYYVDQMLSLIRSHWSRPPLGGGVEVMVYFRIQSGGQIRGLRIARSSGYNSFDLAGLRAVQSAAPFPPLPKSYREGSLGVNLIFR
jgi:protein TonB